ncbi:MAG TPA: response regulator [Candidatus Thermoplasmatota archaeon]|nr:response regulator [Candidatus Thermoplasmatota archaeon]
MSDLKSPTILWAEDSPADQRLIQIALDALPSAPAVRFVANGQQVLERLTDDAPHLVVLDINMPGATGIEVLEKLRTQPATRDMPVILFTSTQNRDELVKAVSLGVEAFVHKPHDLDAFQRAVHRIARSSLRRKPSARNLASPCGGCGHPAIGKTRSASHSGPLGAGPCRAESCPCQGWTAT